MIKSRQFIKRQQQPTFLRQSSLCQRLVMELHAEQWNERKDVAQPIIHRIGSCFYTISTLISDNGLFLSMFWMEL